MSTPHLSLTLLGIVAGDADGLPAIIVLAVIVVLVLLYAARSRPTSR